ncbi:hypothetical protein BGX27_008619 [Mortierella sp. AM989]|nr:hypothetical protein BGX27_008619 [Mortierella sp. AM989]
MLPAASELQRLDTVAPSLMQPSQDLGSRTPMHLVHISNLKLNAQIFSSRSLSIQRRILIKNFLTALYQLHPIEWIEESPADDKDHWMEQTLSAAGIGHSDASAQQEYEDEYDYYSQDCHNYNLALSSSIEQGSSSSGLGQLEEQELSPAAAAAASAVASRRRLRSLRSSNTPLPRPVSMELPMALQSYLSTVFDVDWSVGLASKEDSLFTSKPPQHCPPRSSFASSSLASSTPLNSMSIPAYSSNSTASNRYNCERTQETSSNHPSWNKFTYDKSEYDESGDGVSAADFPAVPQTRVHEDCDSTPIHSNTDSSSERRPKSEPSSSSTSSTLAAASRQDLQPRSNNAFDDNYIHHHPNTQSHIHNHIHIHIHNYPPDSPQNDNRNSNSSSSNEREYLAPATRSSRYPKSELQPRQAGNSLHSHTYALPEAHNESRSYALEFPAPPTKLHHSAPVTIAVAGPLASSTSSSTSPSEAYPPEKAEYIIKDLEEQPYLATAPSAPRRYTRSPPPPPYIQASEDTSNSVYASLPGHRATKSVPIIPLYTSILTTRPQSSPSLSDLSSKPSNNANQKLIEYQRYQERQKIFLRDDDGKNDSRSSEGLSFIRQLFRNNSKKKTTGFVISAPLPSSATSSPLLITSHTPFLLQDLASQELVNQLPSRGSGSTTNS